MLNQSAPRSTFLYPRKAMLLSKSKDFLSLLVLSTHLYLTTQSQWFWWTLGWSVEKSVFCFMCSVSWVSNKINSIFFFSATKLAPFCLKITFVFFFCFTSFCTDLSWSMKTYTTFHVWNSVCYASAGTLLKSRQQWRVIKAIRMV